MWKSLIWVLLGKRSLISGNDFLSVDKRKPANKTSMNENKREAIKHVNKQNKGFF